MLCDPTLYFVEQISQLHANYQRRHAQENITPQKHVDMMKKVDCQYNQF